MSDIPLGLVSCFILLPLIMTDSWLIYMICNYTEKAESFLPNSSFVEANRLAYSQAGLIGKAMRNGFLTVVLMLPERCAKRGILDISEAKNFPKKLKRMFFLSWGLNGFFLIAGIGVGIYIKHFRGVAV
ncbi:hypothetical protein [Pseudomonas sp. DWP3-1-2]|uniref:hypothetical protein n=1 Tax=Pseudomonas sp. DWP3-1-2 TaxID=2804645 RepID=UPI003CEE303F